MIPFVKSIGIVGGGVVGRATARTYTETQEVRVYDVLPQKRTHELRDVLASDLVFVCLPTDSGTDGSLNVEAVDAFFEQVVSKYGATSYVLKSTVPIGTTARVARQYGLPHIVHSPEFLTARCANVDALLPSRNIVGGQLNDAAVKLIRLYAERFPGIPTLLASSEESEAAKLATNAFFAVKVAFFNELKTLADSHGMDWDLLRRLILSDGRITPTHTQVPGPDRQRGFGGKCLPKDAAQFAIELNKKELGAEVTKAALSRNERDRRGY